MLHIDCPLGFDGRGRTATVGAPEHVRDMIEQVLFTAPGERVNRPDFGSGLLQLPFQPNRSDLISVLQFNVQAALQRWLGDLIDMHSVEIFSVDSTLRIVITYALRGLDEPREVTFVRGM